MHFLSLIKISELLVWQLSKQNFTIKEPVSYGVNVSYCFKMLTYGSFGIRCLGQIVSLKVEGLGNHMGNVRKIFIYTHNVLK